MDEELAERIASVVSQSMFVLDSFLSELKEKLGEEEFKEYCQKFGKVMGEAYVQVLDPLWRQYPELLPEKMGGSYKTNDEHYKSIYQLILSQAAEHGS